ncbi:MAG: transporter [Planctomycetaceae bacterium]
MAITASLVLLMAVNAVQAQSDGWHHEPTLFGWAAGEPSAETPERFGPGGKFKDETIITDRPDFTEASTTVGRGVVQLETGYTFDYDESGGTRTYLHSAPEVLTRVGIVADWLELRVGVNHAWERSNDGSDDLSGFDDLYLGAKLALTPQSDLLPEMAIVPQMTVPLGSPVTADQVLPGVNWLYGWDVTDDVSIAGSSQVNAAVGEAELFVTDGVTGIGRSIPAGDRTFAVFAQSATVGYGLTETVGAYTEWFALFPVATGGVPAEDEHYFNGGFTWQATPDLQFDLRSGVGLNEAAGDFFSGAGMATRF